MSQAHTQTHFKRAFLILWILSILGALSVLPYAMTMAQISEPPNMLMVLASNLSLYALLIFIGLKCSQRYFHIYVLTGAREIHWGKFLGQSLLVGALVGLSIVILDKFLFSTVVSPEVYQTHIHIPKWQGLLASFYGGINEEILLRLGLVGFLTWAFAKVTHNTNLAIVLSIVLSTFAFGAGHLPAIYQIIDTPTIPDIIRVMLLNGIAGIAFGLLYWKKSLESAMLAHFCADILLHVAF